MQYLLGIDLGTSGVKAAFFDTDGNVCAHATAPMTVSYPHPGWAQQDPEDWWKATCAAVRAAAEKLSLKSGELAAIGVDGQSWAAVPVNAKDGVLADTPIWMDTRYSALCEELRETIGEKAIFDVCGNPLMPGYTTPKVVGLKRDYPEVYQKADFILQSNGFLVWKLTGAVTQDLSQGYGWHCFDMRKGIWNREMAKSLGIDPKLLPEITPCDSVAGRVTKEAAAACGIDAGIPVVAGGLDAACGTLGVGVIAPGQTQEQGGQAGGMSICLDTYSAHPKLILSYHVIPGKWLLQGGTVGGGAALNWFERELGAEERALASANGGNSFEQLSAEAGQIVPGSEGLTFLPYMAGERSPLWNPDAKGVFYGLDYQKTRAHMARSVMEGVAYSVRHNIETAAEAGAEVGELRAMGGSANSLVWTQIKSDVLGRPIVVPGSDDATTLGAALLAGVGTGVYRDYREATEKTVRIRRKHEPNAENAQVYENGYRKYIALGRALAPFMNKTEEAGE